MTGKVRKQLIRAMTDARSSSVSIPRFHVAKKLSDTLNDMSPNDHNGASAVLLVAAPPPLLELRLAKASCEKEPEPRVGPGPLLIAVSWWRRKVETDTPCMALIMTQHVGGLFSIRRNKGDGDVDDADVVPPRRSERSWSMSPKL